MSRILFLAAVCLLTSAPLCRASPGGEEDDLNIRAWPLVVSTKGEDGSKTVWATPFFHYTRHADGRVSFHLLNYFQGPDHQLFFPLAYRAGEEDREHRGLVPLYFDGPGYRTLPPFLYLSLDRGESTRTIWITPLFHLTCDKDGNSWFHLATYFQGPDYKILFPLAYQAKSSRGSYSGIVPLIFQCNRSWYAPLLLSASWEGRRDSRSTWITPFFHVTRDGDGMRSFHLANYFQGPDYKVLFPLAWYSGRGEDRQVGVMPFYAGTPQTSVLLPLLTAWGRSDRGSKFLWITPLFHRTWDDRGTRSFHLANYFQGWDYKVLFPLAYLVDRTGGRHGGIVPLYFQGPDYWTAPLLLSARWRKGDGSASTWITPLFHHTRGKEGESWFHLGPYFHGPDYNILFPLGYRVKEGDEAYMGIVPLYYHQPGHTIIPPLLTWSRTLEGGGRSTWVTPFFHLTRDRSGKQWFHLLNYFQGPNYKFLFPLAYSLDKPSGNRAGIIPIYFQGPDYKVLFPLGYICGNEEERHYGLMPLVMTGPGYTILPLILSGWGGSEDGARAVWITPLFHTTWNTTGGSRFHILTYFQGPGYKILLPLAYSVQSRKGRYAGLVPLYFQDPESRYAPLLLSGSWKRDDGGRSTWITPLFHQSSDIEGALSSRHLLTWFEGRDYRVLFPLYWNWQNRAGDDQTMIPLLYWSRTRDSGYCSRSFLWPLSEYRRGNRLDTSFATRMKPFLYQRAGDDYEFNFLWKLFQVKREEEASSLTVGPFWWSERPERGKPAEWQILGGLLGRDCDYKGGTSRHRIFWFFPVGSRQSFNDR